jgi:hypothetical protein
MLYGPNTNNGSILTIIEAQVERPRTATANGHRVDRRQPDVMGRYSDEVQQAIAGVQVWNAGCNGYYRTPSGRIVTQWPFSMLEFQERTAAIDSGAFEVGVR